LVRDTNQPSLQASIQTNFPNAKVVTLRTATDSPTSLESLLREGLEAADVVITTGGVSMGEADLMKSVLERSLGATVWFGRVMMKPGKPTTFATISSDTGANRKLIFALPGNPVSALGTFSLHVVMYR
jgi:gephyrin